MTRYLVRYVLRNGKVVLSGNTFQANHDGLQIIRYYVAPQVTKGAQKEGARVEYAPCQYEVGIPVRDQRPAGDWTQLVI